MDIDTEGLTAEPMKKVMKDWQGTRYYDPRGVLVCKTCTKCRNNLPVGKFPKMSGQKDGLATRCSPCGSAISMDNYRKKIKATPKPPPVFKDVLEVLDPATGMTVTIHGVEEVVMKKTTASPWRGRSYYNQTGTLVAKTCSRCKCVILSEGFGRSTGSGRRGGLESACKVCNSIRYYDQLMQREVREPGFLKNRSHKRYSKLTSRTPVEVALDTIRLRPGGVKWCRKCKEFRKIYMFNTNRYMSDGLSVMCSDCHNQDFRDKYHKAAEKKWDEEGIPHVCYLSTCGKPYQEQDHVIPLELDGPDELWNLLPMCAHHNRSKNSTPLLVWLGRRHPEALKDTLLAVLSYGVSPWTYLDSPRDISQVLSEAGLDSNHGIMIRLEETT